jgi:hypothetical protein
MVNLSILPVISEAIGLITPVETSVPLKTIMPSIPPEVI